MPEENEDIKIKEGLSEIIPDSLLDVFSAEETNLQIAQICLENNISGEGDIENIGYGIGLVLLGQLKPNDLPIFLEKGLKINNEIAQKIYKKVDETVFSSVKNDLSELYAVKQVGEQPVPPSRETKEVQLEPIKPSAKDTYREKLE